MVRRSLRSNQTSLVGRFAVDRRRCSRSGSVPGARQCRSGGSQRTGNHRRTSGPGRAGFRAGFRRRPGRTRPSLGPHSPAGHLDIGGHFVCRCRPLGRNRLCGTGSTRSSFGIGPTGHTDRFASPRCIAAPHDLAGDHGPGRYHHRGSDDHDHRTHVNHIYRGPHDN